MRDGLNKLGWWLTILVGAGFLMPRFASWGTYVDGTLYATIARNMAEGRGTCWDPFYTEGIHQHFAEHPPLGLILESLLFRVFGDHFWIEKLFGLLLLITTIPALRSCWRSLARLGANDLDRYFWAALLCWFLIPLWPWMYGNNMLENPLLLFSAWSVACILKAEALPWKKSVAWHAAAVACLAATFLSKGPFGLFPIAVPLFVSVVRDGKISLRSLAAGSALAIGAAAAVASLCLYEPIRHNLNVYLRDQVFASLNGEKGAHAKGRLYLMWELAKQLYVVALPIALMGALSIRKIPWPATKSVLRVAALPVLIGISASVPLLASPRHSKHYLGPSLAFYALALGCCLALVVHHAVAARAWRWLDRLPKSAHAVCATLLAGVCAFGCWAFGHPLRDEEHFEAIAKISREVPGGSTIGAAKSLGDDWALIAYLYRFHHISLDARKTNVNRDFYLGESALAEGFASLPLELPNKYVLGRRISAQAPAVPAHEDVGVRDSPPVEAAD